MAVFYLIFSIVFSTSINVIFRWFKDYKIDKLQAVVVNYFVCFLLGFLFSENKNLVTNTFSDWFLYCFFLGFFFIAIFMAMAYTTDKIGISVNAVSSKMAVVIPILFAYLFLNETLNNWFLVGLLLSLVSIYLISVKPHLNISRRHYVLPIIVFIGSGIIDTALKLLENSYGEKVDLATLSYTIFLGAGVAGTIVFLVSSRGNFRTLKWSSLTGGIILGVPNYFSIWFLLSAIQAFSLKSAFVFGINNVGIVLLSTLLSMFIFKEHLTFRNKLGLFLAAVSIAIIAYVV